MLFYCWGTPGILDIRQTWLVSVPLSVRFPPHFLAPPSLPPILPHLFFLAGPTQVLLYLSHHSSTNPLCHSSIYPKPFSVVSGLDNLSAIHPLHVPTQPARLQLEWPHMKAGNHWTMWDQMFLLRLADMWSPHTALQHCCSLLPFRPSQGISKWTPNIALNDSQLHSESLVKAELDLG